MEERNSRKLLTQFNCVYKQLDDIYHCLARHYGLSDSAFWVLYTIREEQGEYTQSQLCEMLSLSKQTINSALKNLESAGYIRLEAVEGNQKSKKLVLTEAGERLAQRSVDSVLGMELRAFDQFTAKEQDAFSRLLACYVHRLEREAQSAMSTPLLEGVDENYNH